MSFCPKCSFQNPPTNKFCQKCGTSLTHKACKQCGYPEVPLSAANCPQCGVLVGKVWWAAIAKNVEQSAVITEDRAEAIRADAQASANATEPSTAEAEPLLLEEPMPVEVETSAPLSPEGSEAEVSLNWPLPEVEANSTDESPQPETSSQSDSSDISPEPLVESAVAATNSEDNSPEEVEEPSPEEVEEPPAAVEYLGAERRYQVLEEPIPAQIANGKEIRRVRVLDLHPLQKSPLEALLASSSGRAASATPETGEATAWEKLDLPAMAKSYLRLRSSLASILPALHDAWRDPDGQEVVLLEDRSDWQVLGDLWSNQQVSMLQILWWLGEMAILWEELEGCHCRQSLLEIDNLRVDEDQTIALQQLYLEPESAELTLQDLGKTWHLLFHKTHRTLFSSLVQMLYDLGKGDIKTIQELRERLRDIANELQPGTNAPAEPEPAENGEAIETQEPGSSEEALVESGASDDLPTVVLPKQLVRLDDAGSTHPGRQRNYNEDSFAIDIKLQKQETPKGQNLQAHGLYVLCDGMGGHAGGEVASALAVDTLRQYFATNWQEQFPSEDAIKEGVRLANRAIYEINQKNSSSGTGRMGTTLVMLLVQDNKIAIGHVGDSRLYGLTRGRGLERLTVDHEVGQREIQRGVEPAIAYSRPDAYQLTQALGPRDENFIKPDVKFIELEEDTLLILGSDGLTDNDLLENNWQKYLAPLLSSSANLEKGVQELVDFANEYNGHDNITAVLVRAKVGSKH
ncbi:MAG: serine/threonine phosphatase [Cyanosarcina radialis HA8281-LM2]|jgi:serine/threonine protein phosphatase PrpC|nr:serine/threonine phosphatase [Cyanosarcina radialis HA8281-LM2]